VFFFPTFCKCQTGFFCDGSGVKFAIMSFILSKFVATEEFFFFSHPGYSVFLQIAYLAMAFEYMATILAMVI
jgi:hypothetical protein